jgi:DNA polymerase-3 subunit gamma/tau
VLSRCQRFDLRRVDVPVLVAHFKKIVANEGGEAEDEALASIARAAEGSVRDGLSLLDQALAMSAGKVEARARARHAGARRPRAASSISGEAAGRRTAEALDMFAACTATGPSPGQILADLAEAVHVTTRAKTLGAAARARALGEERRAAVALAERLSVAILARAWQMLLKGLEEIAGRPIQAAARRWC